MMPDTDDDESKVRERDHNLLQRHAEQLAEHFSTVQIVATREESDGTRCASYGSGNWYARYGSVRSWLLKREEEMREEVRQQGE